MQRASKVILLLNPTLALTWACAAELQGHSWCLELKGGLDGVQKTFVAGVLAVCAVGRSLTKPNCNLMREQSRKASPTHFLYWMGSAARLIAGHSTVTSTEP